MRYRITTVFLIVMIIATVFQSSLASATSVNPSKKRRDLTGNQSAGIGTAYCEVTETVQPATPNASDGAEKKHSVFLPLLFRGTTFHPPTRTPNSTPTPTPTQTLLPTCTATATSTPLPTYTPTPTATATATCRPTYTPLPTQPTYTPLPTNTLYPTNTPWPTDTPYPIIPTITLTVTPIIELSAFPRAEGFGANSVGGRGGRVIEVTNLNDSGQGSLRAAIEAEGPRIVVFRTGGTIEIQNYIQLSNPYITIAGQTAPGGGITLKNGPGNVGPPLFVKTHDVVIRGIRFRPGAPSAVAGDNVDAITIGDVGGSNTYNIILDHCSFSWAVDETVGCWYGPHDLTIQWSIISEALNNSSHTKGAHSKGLLLASEGSENLSVHHCLLAHNVDRNPLVKTSGIVDFVNNVIYNPKYGSDSNNDYAQVPFNYVGNFFKRGPDSVLSGWGSYELQLSEVTSKGFSVFVEGNIGPHRPDDDLDEWLIVEPGMDKYRTMTEHDAPSVDTTSAFDALDQVLKDAGANMGLGCDGSFYERRDSVDGRIVEDVVNGTGGIIDDPSEVGGWPMLDMGTPCVDSDHDGMPSVWEKSQGFDPSDPSDGPADADGDGYTNVEEFLNAIDL